MVVYLGTCKLKSKHDPMLHFNTWYSTKKKHFICENRWTQKQKTKKKLIW